MWKAIISAALGVALAAGSAHAICGDVTGEGEISTSDALAVLRASVGQQQNLTCDCGTGGVCTEDGSNDGCEGVDENSACSTCCEQSNDCDDACAAANAVSCDFDALNEACAQQINEAGCGSVCCPGE
jgi:hypothetical protein